MEYRKATFADIEEIYHLVNDYATDGVMLARSRNTLYETLRDMIVAIDDEGKVVGVGGLHIIWDRLAEIRTMAVAPDMTRQGIGAEIVRRLIEEGDVFGVEKYFTDLQAGFFPEARLPDDHERRTAAQGLEGMHRLPEVPELR